MIFINKGCLHPPYGETTELLCDKTVLGLDSKRCLTKLNETAEHVIILVKQENIYKKQDGGEET